jgi:hypothetical protein
MQAEIDTSKPHAARIYDYLLGGKDHFAIDRETAEKGIKLIPTGRTAARENRTFLGRAVRYLVAEAGIRQFLDIGAGLPSANNVHEVAQAQAPESRVVYVDNDPIVLTHARAPTPGRCPLRWPLSAGSPGNRDLRHAGGQPGKVTRHSGEPPGHRAPRTR